MTPGSPAIRRRGVIPRINATLAFSGSIRFFVTTHRWAGTPGGSRRDVCSPRAASVIFEPLHGILGARRGRSTRRTSTLQSSDRRFHPADHDVAAVSSQPAIGPAQRCRSPVAAFVRPITPLYSAERKFRSSDHTVVLLRTQVPFVLSHRCIRPNASSVRAITQLYCSERKFHSTEYNVAFART